MLLPAEQLELRAHMDYLLAKIARRVLDCSRYLVCDAVQYLHIGRRWARSQIVRVYQVQKAIFHGDTDER